MISVTQATNTTQIVLRRSRKYKSIREDVKREQQYYHFFRFVHYNDIRKKDKSGKLKSCVCQKRVGHTRK